MNKTNHKNQQPRPKQFTLYILGFGLLSLIYSPFLLSIAMFGLIALAVFDISSTKKMVFSDSFRKKWGDFFKNPAFWTLLLVFIPFLISGLYSENSYYWLSRVRIKMPFLGLPIAFYFLPKLSQNDFRKLALFYIILMMITATGVTINYALNFEAINDMIGRGQNIPVPRNHIRFSLGVAIGVMLSLGLYFDHKPIKKWQKTIALSIGIVLFLFQHLLAVRSGIAGMYLGTLVYLIKAFTLKGYRIYGFTGVALLILMPFLGNKYIPSLEKKVGYMLYDWEMRIKGKGKNYSDSERLRSMQAGIKIGNQHAILGVGVGDIREEMDKYLDPSYQKKNLLPHNEYIFYYATTGFVGLGLMMIGILTPLFYRRHYKNVVFLSVQIILLLSFFVEATLETSTGTGYYLYWSLIGILFITNDKSH